MYGKFRPARKPVSSQRLLPLNQVPDAPFALLGWSSGESALEEGGILMVFAHPLCGSLFGFEQLVHGHGLVVLLGCVICSLAIKNHMYECGFAKIAHWILPEERFGPTSALPTIRGLNSGLTHAEHNAIPNPTAADYGS
jgi:hypothetical protein